MRFSMFLNENKGYISEATVTLHKIISMADSAHIDMGNDIRFNIGSMTKTGAYEKLWVVIRVDGTKSVRLARFRADQNMAIVISVDSLPERDKIDTLLSSHAVYQNFIKTFASYLDKHHDHNAEYDKNDLEIAEENIKNFEENYNALIDEFKSTNLEQYKKTAEAVQTHIDSTANVIEQTTAKLSFEKLKKEYLGADVSEFLNIVKKLKSYEKFDKLDKTLKEKLESRLKSFYKSSVKNIT